MNKRKCYTCYMGECLLMAILIQNDCLNTKNINFVSFIVQRFFFHFIFILYLSLCAASTFILILMQLIALYIYPEKNKTIIQ